jgi:hypothetical protein
MSHLLIITLLILASGFFTIGILCLFSISPRDDEAWEGSLNDEVEK